MLAQKHTDKGVQVELLAGSQLTTELAPQVELGAAPVGEARAEAAPSVGTAAAAPVGRVHQQRTLF